MACLVFSEWQEFFSICLKHDIISIMTFWTDFSLNLEYSKIGDLPILIEIVPRELLILYRVKFQT